MRWIDERLATGAFSEVAGTPEAAKSTLLDVRDLVDKCGNPISTVRQKIAEGVAVLRAGLPLIVCCDYGISRSNAIAAGILAVFREVPFADAVRLVLKATSETEMKIPVLSQVWQAIQAEDGITAECTSENILVTGGSGFVGRGLLGRLRAVVGEGRVHAPSSREVDALRNRSELYLYARMHGIGTIIHLANTRVYTNNSALGDTLVMLQNVLDVCAEQCIRLVYVSSWEVFSGYHSTGLLADEGLPRHAEGVYGMTKVFAEEMIERRGAQDNFPVAVVRLPPLYAIDGDRPRFIFNFMERAFAGKAIAVHRYQNGLPALDLLHRDDAADLLARVACSDFQGCLHGGTGNLTSTTDVAIMIVAHLGSRAPIEHIQVNRCCCNIAMDGTRARRLFDWQPNKSVESGLLELAATFVKARGRNA